MSDIRGRFLWYELMTADTEAAKAFYTKLTGWGVSVWENPDGRYEMWTAGEQPIGGMMAMPDEASKAGAPPHWLGYVGTPDVDATAILAAELGGKVIVKPTDIPTVGRFAVLTDPQGAVFAIFAPAQPPGPLEAQPGIGKVDWHELAAGDASTAWSFYERLFGWNKTEAMDMGEMGVYQMYGLGAVTLGGIFTKPKEMPFPPHWLYYVHVPDVNAGVEQVKALGGKVLNGPMEVPGGSLIAQCMDPQGAAFALHSDAKRKT